MTKVKTAGTVTVLVVLMCVIGVTSLTSIKNGIFGLLGKSDNKGGGERGFSNVTHRNSAAGGGSKSDYSGKRFVHPPSVSPKSNLDRARDMDNAAEIYTMALALLGSEEMKAHSNRIQDLTGFGVTNNKVSELTDAEKEELRMLIASPDMREFVELLEEASWKDVCDFKVDYSDFQAVSLTLPRLNQMRNAERLICGMALAAAADGDLSESTELITLGFTAAENVTGESVFIQQMVLLGCDSITMLTINFITQTYSVPEDQAHTLMTELAKRDYAAGFISAINYEISLNRDNWCAPGDDEGKSQWLKVIGNEELFEKYCAKWSECYSELVRLLSLPYDDSVQKQVEKFVGDIEAIPKEEYGLVQATMPDLMKTVKRVNDMNARMDTALRGLATSIYRNRYGKEPESSADLKEIMDTVPGLAGTGR